MWEAYVASQQAVGHQLFFPKAGNLFVDGNHLLEIGGKNGLTFLLMNGIFGQSDR